MTVPTNSQNLALGNFMVNMYLTSAKNATIAQVRRSVRGQTSYRGIRRANEHVLGHRPRTFACIPVIW